MARVDDDLLMELSDGFMSSVSSMMKPNLSSPTVRTSMGRPKCALVLLSKGAEFPRCFASKWIFIHHSVDFERAYNDRNHGSCFPNLQNERHQKDRTQQTSCRLLTSVERYPQNVGGRVSEGEQEDPNSPKRFSHGFPLSFGARGPR